MKKVFLIATLTLSAASAFAQEAATKSFWDDPINDPMLPFYLVIGLIGATAILIATIGIYLVKVLNTLAQQAEKEKAEKLGKVYVPTPSLWAKFVQRINDAVPVAEEKNIELDHNYDGIKELDNHLPPWWKWLLNHWMGSRLHHCLPFLAQPSTFPSGI
jgi:cytochrome c oxidase cbb3-type subunit 3